MDGILYAGSWQALTYSFPNVETVCCSTSSSFCVFFCCFFFPTSSSQGGLACCNPWGHKDLDTIEQLNWTELQIRGKLIWVEIKHSKHFPIHKRIPFQIFLPNHPIIHLKYLMASSLNYFSIMLKNTFLQEFSFICEYKLWFNLAQWLFHVAWNKADD